MFDLLEKIAEKKVTVKNRKEHPVSEEQRRWAWAAEERGKLPKGKAHAWSKRVEGEHLPKYSEGEPMALTELEKVAKKLSYEQKQELPSSTFAVHLKRPDEQGKKEKYPVPDIKHARNALARVATFGSPKEKQEVEAKVESKYPALGKRHEEAKEEKTASALEKLATITEGQFGKRVMNYVGSKAANPEVKRILSTETSRRIARPEVAGEVAKMVPHEAAHEAISKIRGIFPKAGATGTYHQLEQSAAKAAGEEAVLETLTKTAFMKVEDVEADQLGIVMPNQKLADRAEELIKKEKAEHFALRHPLLTGIPTLGIWPLATESNAIERVGSRLMRENPKLHDMVARNQATQHSRQVELDTANQYANAAEALAGGLGGAYVLGKRIDKGGDED